MLRDFGVSISKRQVVRILTSKIDAFVAEARQVLTAGLASAGWISVDDTGARHGAVNGLCTQLGNDCGFQGMTGRDSDQNPDGIPI
ncbi:hypothetical protein LRP31_34055 (plasmid) [Mesorhizobium mediterraneum]|uniref:Transposase n=1 Tax=Mesorhizobium mediterraneum TaxID=43617 RepID=A0AB36R1D9_9HYPH|nr:MULTISPECIES: hypothetical protein [Mesorhizobium]PAP98567.1 hypothetical protein CIT25_30065 [Mesorhizobium mediterraneum]RUU84488.1 hypothetical protein EOB59_34180 [Mesorhizobium sp. M7A.F.Ca.MR.176.00.0.0]RWA97023.1 MAG: hypothetical protein EOQ37_35440 [Mesorhizobium sp.]RWB08484.1 MAG: hypothetical protein EOQ39_35415 [Mesorhizobium sp.]RWN24634.1 MAG: hypothetical protein EOR95_31515 [Mesorhizobium sp.]